MTEESRGRPCESQPHTNGPPALGALLRRQLWVAIALIAIALPFGEAIVRAVAVGAAISLANTRLLAGSVTRLLQPETASGGIVLRLFLHLRLVALLAIVAWVLARTELSPIAFTAGLSSVVPAALWHGWSSREI